jgi:hypothetical protein
MKVGPHRLSFLNFTKPYGDSLEISERFGKAMPKESQRTAWAQHTAWIAVDYVGGSLDADFKYAVLSKLCTQMVDSNCVGVYIPGYQVFIPNDGSLLPALQRLSSEEHP